MATVYGVNATKMQSPIGSTTDRIIDSGFNKGQVCSMYDTYEASALAAASVIEMCDKLPKGAIVTKILLLTDDLGTSVTIDIGDSADDDRYASAVDVATAAKTFSWPETAAAADIANVGYIVGTASGDDQITLTINTSAATATIKLLVEYCV